MPTDVEKLELVAPVYEDGVGTLYRMVTNAAALEVGGARPFCYEVTRNGMTKVKRAWFVRLWPTPGAQSITGWQGDKPPEIVK